MRSHTLHTDENLESRDPTERSIVALVPLLLFFCDSLYSCPHYVSMEVSAMNVCRKNINCEQNAEHSRNDKENGMVVAVL